MPMAIVPVGNTLRVQEQLLEPKICIPEWLRNHHKIPKQVPDDQAAIIIQIETIKILIPWAGKNLFDDSDLIKAVKSTLSLEVLKKVLALSPSVSENIVNETIQNTIFILRQAESAEEQEFDK